MFRDRDRPVTVPSPSRHHPVTLPSLGVLNRPTSLSVFNRPLALFVLRTLKDGLGRLRTVEDGWGRLRTLKDVGRFRTPRDGTVTGWWRDGDGTVTVTGQKRWLRCIISWYFRINYFWKSFFFKDELISQLLYSKWCLNWMKLK